MMLMAERNRLRQRILAAARELFHRHGIRAVGVEAIAEAAATNKMTLYRHFGSKDELVAMYLTRRAAHWQRHLLAELRALPDGSEPRGRLTCVFDAVHSWHAENGRRGCAFVNAHAEISDSAHPARRVIAEEKRWMRQVFVAVLDPSGESATSVATYDAATQVHLVYEGYLVLSTLAPADDLLARAKTAALAAAGAS